MRPLARGIVAYVIGTCSVLAMGLALSPPVRPHTPARWVLLAPILLGLYLVGDGAFGPVLTQKLGRNISQRRFSLLRIGVALLLMIPFVVAVVAFSLILGAR